MSNDTDRKWAHALTEADAAGIGPWTVNPPLTRLMRAARLPVRPPHYTGFWTNVVTMGGYFGAVWGFLMWAVLWREQPSPLWLAFAASAMSGILFGLWMAYYYARGHRNSNLSDWDQL